MAQASFNESISIQAPIDKIKALLSDIPSMERFHPFIKSMSEEAADTSQFGTPRRRFAIVDRMHVGPFAITFTYHATSTLDGEQNIYNEAFQSPNIHLVIVYHCFAEGDTTRIEEHTTVSAPRLLLGFTKKNGQLAHHVLLQKMKAYLEAENNAAMPVLSNRNEASST